MAFFESRREGERLILALQGEWRAAAIVAIRAEFRQLELEGLLEILHRPGSEFVRPEYQRRVRLLAPIESSDNSEAGKLTSAQQKVIEALQGRESLSFQSNSFTP